MLHASVISVMIAGLPLQAGSREEISRAVQESVLEATVRVQHLASRGDGSGVVIAHENGSTYILTAAHVVPDGDDVAITFYPRDGRPIEMRGLVRDRAANEDIAMIVVQMKKPPSAIAPLCPKAELPPKFLPQPLPVVTTGLGPLGKPESILDRITDHKLITKPDSSQAFHWEADKEQAIGRSGGGLFDGAGRLIGICSGTRAGKGYYVSIYEIRSVLSKRGWRFLVK